MSIEASRALVARLLREAQQGNFVEVLVGACRADAVIHSPLGTRGGLRHLQAIRVQMQSAFPDMELELLAETYDGDRVALQFQFDGTNSGPMLGLTPTGRRVEMPLAFVLRVEQSQIAELWFYANTTGPIVRERLGELGLL